MTDTVIRKLVVSSNKLNADQILLYTRIFLLVDSLFIGFNSVFPTKFIKIRNKIKGKKKEKDRIEDEL